MNYSQFLKPSRYIGSEVNASNKREAAVSVALAFPDLYEVGMSHIGLKILYEVINNIPYASAERVFMPAPDMAAYLKANRMPLCSIESGRPLSGFDVLGFSLQYELSYTTVLEMLSLSGIPLLTEDRLKSQSNLPIVIAGGPCTVNPLPMAPFIDAFFIGEAEEAIVEILASLRACKGCNDRLELLSAVGEIEGVYVPIIHGGSKTIKRRFIRDLDSAPFPIRPVVPYMSVVHDRIAIEITRGCPRGCRFCQAGIIYRPFRHRSVERVLSIAQEALRNTGHDTVSFASLSAGDYPCLLEAMGAFNNRFRADNISLSLPSLRVGSVTKEMLRELKAVRKSGFTIAPEAATDRLRRVINKDFTNDDYEKALVDLFEAGWLNLKLYFMIGLPTEGQEDIAAIPRMTHQALKIARSKTKRFVNVSVTVSPFIPKAHTPFQWLGQMPSAQIQDTLGYLRGKLADKRVKYKGHDHRMSLLEALIARGDEGLSPLIMRAWELGAVLDGWSEYFDFGVWQKAAEDTGIDLNTYAQKTFDISRPLPWDFIDTGIEKDFLIGQYKTAFSGEITPPCDAACSACGLACSSNMTPRADIVAYKAPAPIVERVKQRVRVCFSKTGILRHLSHLELTHLILRALRRAEVRLVHSMGFHPAPAVSFSPPLSVGVAGLSEYFDMEVFIPFDIELTIDRINHALPQGVHTNYMALISQDIPSLTAFIRRYDYTVKNEGLPLNSDDRDFIILRDGKEIDLRACIYEIERGTEGEVNISLIDRESQKARLSEIVRALFKREMTTLDVTRTAMYGYDKGWVKPL